MYHKGTTPGVTVLFLSCFVFVCMSTHACTPNVKGPIEEQWLAGLQVDGNANFDDGSKGPNLSDWLKKGVVLTCIYVCL